MMAEEKVMAVCNEAGVEVRSGTMIVVTVMSLVYNAIQNLSEVIINLVK